MKHYRKLLELGCFSRNELVQITGSEAAANSIIYNYLNNGFIERVKHDLYATISLETKQPVSSKYQIGSSLFEDACISHHGAFEYYGYANQVFYEITVATKSRFKDFEYNGIMYKRVPMLTNKTVVREHNTAVTGIEQTVVDSIKDFDSIAGLEELLRCIKLIPLLESDKLLAALEDYGNGFLYQKCGYILEHFQDELFLPDSFFEKCLECSSKAIRSLSKTAHFSHIDKKWKLYVPLSLLSIVNKGDDYSDVFEE